LHWRPFFHCRAALAANGAHAQPAEVIFLAQLVLLMLTGRLLPEQSQAGPLGWRKGRGGIIFLSGEGPAMTTRVEEEK
jgi:hypothetical protein